MRGARWTVRPSDLRAEARHKLDDGQYVGTCCENVRMMAVGIITCALRQFPTAHNKEDLDTMVELAKRKELRPIVPPRFDLSTYANACVSEGDHA